jgi:hypothetical protein
MKTPVVFRCLTCGIDFSEIPIKLISGKPFCPHCYPKNEEEKTQTQVKVVPNKKVSSKSIKIKLS